MDVLRLPTVELDIELGQEELDRSPVPTSVYIVAKRQPQRWLSEATRWDRAEPIAVLDLASAEGEFSATVCHFATARDKLAVWVDRDERMLAEGLQWDKAFRAETIVADLETDDWRTQLAGRRFDRVTLGLAHHYLGEDRYVQVLTNVMREHLAPDGVVLIVEICAGLYDDISREMVLPHLLGSIPDFAIPIAATPKLIQSTVLHRNSGRQWTIEYFSTALAMPDDRCKVK